VNLKQLADAKRYGKGTSKSAERRRAVANRGTALSGAPGQTISDSRGTPYLVMPDGSHRRLR
jgi:hypothetical protein